MLRLCNISKRFNEGTINEITVIKNISLEVKKGDFITIVGSNGAGKSTLLNIIAGSYSLNEGEILLDGKDLTKLSEEKRAVFIGRVFQDPTKGTAPSMTILENLALADNKGQVYGLGFCIKKDRVNFYKEELSKLNLGLENKLNTKVSMLSGGQRQALSLIMATLKRPEILLLDEHTAALDPNTSENIINITENLVKEKHITTIMITHNINHAIGYGNRLIMMHQGEIILDKDNEEKAHITKESLISEFSKVTLDSGFDDRAILA